MTTVFSWQNAVSLFAVSFALQSQTCLLLLVSLDLLLLHSSPPMIKGTSFAGVSSRRSCRSSQNHSTSASLALVVGAQTWVNTAALISHANKVMFKVLQVRLQRYVERELADVQVGFRKGRGSRDQIANICWIIENAKEFQKNSNSTLLIMPKC